MEQMSQQIDQLALALSKLQSEIMGAKKDAINPFFKSKYADLESVWEACRKPLTKNGLSVSQCQCIIDGKAALTTILMHSSGQWIRGLQLLNPKDDSPQAAGSALSYARRYGLAAIIGVVQVDDDAEIAQGRNQSNQNYARPSSSIQPKQQPAFSQDNHVK